VDVALKKVRSLGRCCLGKVGPLMAGSADEVLLVSLSCPLPLLGTHPPSLLACCLSVFVELGATITASGRLAVYLFLSEKRVERDTSGWYEPKKGEVKVGHTNTQRIFFTDQRISTILGIFQLQLMFGMCVFASIPYYNLCFSVEPHT